MSKKQVIMMLVILAIAIGIAFFINNAAVRITVMCIAAALISAVTRKVGE